MFERAFRASRVSFPTRFPVALGPISLCLLIALPLPAATPEHSGISGVSISRPFFNPALGQGVQISFVLADPGSLTILILDRDGYLVRKLVADKAFEAGSLSFEWNGHDDRGEVVPDEAYSLKIDLASHSGSASYFPGNTIPEELPPRPAIYDRLSGIVSYKLPVPARVHIQAGSARLDKAGQAHGPVLKTLANREPRTGGPVIETWNGWDESGTIRVCDLPYFAIAVASTALPEKSIITVGNREATFFDWVRRRQGSSFLTVSAAHHAHHRGLRSLEDVAPKLKLKPQNASWSAAERLWLTSQKAIEVSASVEGPTAEAFLSHPGKLMVFLDLKNIRTLPASETGSPIRVPIADLSAGPHRISVNWVSDYGPVAVNSVLFRVEGTWTAKTASK